MEKHAALDNSFSRIIVLIPPENPHFNDTANYFTFFKGSIPLILSHKINDTLQEEFSNFKLQNVDFKDINPVWSKFIGSVYKLVYLKNDQIEINKIDKIITFEIFSSLSYQVSNFTENKAQFIIVYESLSQNPIYKIPPFRMYTQEIVRSSCHIIARSYRARESLLKLGVSNDRIKVIYPGIDLIRFKPQKEMAFDNAITILYAGRLDRDRGIIELLKAHKELRRHYDYKLIVCGDGKERGLVQSFIKKDLEYKGYIGKNEFEKTFRESDIFIHPVRDMVLRYFTCPRIENLKTYEDQLSYSIPTALASGLPIVTTDSGAAPEAVGKDNIIVRQGSYKSLMKGISILLEDENLRSELSKRNRQRAEKLFDIRKQSAKMEYFILGKN